MDKHKKYEVDLIRTGVGTYQITFAESIRALTKEEFEKFEQEGRIRAEEWTKLHPHATGGDPNAMEGGGLAAHWAEKYSHEDWEQE